MGNLTNCIAKAGKALDEADRKDLLARYEAHVKDGMPASDAGELAIREVHDNLRAGLQAFADDAAKSGVQVLVVDKIPDQTGGGPPAAAADPAVAAENERAAKATPFGFASIVLKVLSQLEDVYRAPRIPKNIGGVDKAVKLGIPGAVKVAVPDDIALMGGVDPMAGANSPEMLGRYGRSVEEEAKFKAYAYEIPRADGSTTEKTPLFVIKVYSPTPNNPMGAIEVDVSRVGTGNNGALVYNVAAGLAAANGMPFRADSAGLKTFGVIRRTVTMMNAAMRYGVQVVEPGEGQVRVKSSLQQAGITPLKWVVRGLGVSAREANANDARNEANFENLLRAEAQSVRQVVGDVIDQYAFDFETGGFTKNGQPVDFGPTSPEVAALVQAGARTLNDRGIAADNPMAERGSTVPARPTPPYGRASIARAILAQSLARVDGDAARVRVLDAARKFLSGATAPRDLLNLWSQAAGGKPAPAGDTVKSKDRAITLLKGAWGAAFSRAQADKKVELLTSAEAVKKLKGAPGADTAKGWYDPETGIAYIVYDNNTADEIAGTYLHEVGVHVAAPRWLGLPLYDATTNALMAAAESGADPRAAAALAAARAALTDANGNRIASDDSVRHETLAYLAEMNPGDGVVTKLLDAFKATLNAMGFRLTRLESDTDLVLRVMRDALRAEARGLTGTPQLFQGDQQFSLFGGKPKADTTKPTPRAEPVSRREMRGADQAWRQEAKDRRDGTPPSREWSLRFSQRIDAITKESDFQRWADGLPVVKDGTQYSGRPAVIAAYHGSTHGDIEIFDEVGNTEGFLGEGPYFTTNPVDASENYAGIGPDLAFRIEKRADELLQKSSERELLEDYFDANPKVERPYSGELDDDEAYELFQEYGEVAAYDVARRELIGKAGGVVYPVFVKVTNPASISPRFPTKVRTEEQAESLMAAMKVVNEEVGFALTDAMDVVRKEVERGIKTDNPASHWNIFDALMRLLPSYVYDVGGQSLRAGAIFRRIVKQAGHDAVVMDAGATFARMANVTPGTLHVVPFEKTHVKSSLGNVQFGVNEQRFMFSQRVTAQSIAAAMERETMAKAAAKPWAYSALANAVKVGKGSPKKGGAAVWKQWLNGANARGEFKDSERSWLGVDQWLDAQTGDIARDDLIRFVGDNQVHVSETVLENENRRAGTMSFDEWAAAEMPSEYERMQGMEDAQNRAFLRQVLQREYANRVQFDAPVKTEGAPKFELYQLPGGSNYRELLLTLPPKAETPKFDPSKVEIRRSRSSVTQGTATIFYDGQKIGGPFSDEGLPAQNYRRPDSEWMQTAERIFNEGIRDPMGRVVAESVANRDAFRSSHFDQPNILAHVRFNERTDADGKRVLFVEEVQSDWHQQGRKKGYGSREMDVPRTRRTVVRQLPERYQYTNRNGVTFAWAVYEYEGGRILDGSYPTEADARAAQDLIDPPTRRETVQGVPDAPLKKEWPLTAMKRVIRWAAENGFDRIAWTTGEQQVERYRDALRQSVDRIEWTKEQGGVRIVGYKDGQEVTDTREREDALSDAIGKSMADRIIESPDQSGVIEGDDITVSDTGMAGFYDKMLPNELGKYVKKWGGSVGSTTIMFRDPDNTWVRGGRNPFVIEQSLMVDYEGPVAVANRHTGVTTRFDTRAEGRRFIARELGKADEAKVQSLDITPAMREAAMEGVPMWSQRTPAQKELLRKAGMPVDERGLVSRGRDSLRSEWEKAKAAWHDGVDARIQALADRFRGVSAAEAVIEAAIGRKLEANESSYVMMRMNLGLPSIMDAVLQYGAPRLEDQTWTQWADVDGVEVFEQAPSRPAAEAAIKIKYPGATTITMKRKPTTIVPGVAEQTGMSGGRHGVFVRNTDTKGLLEALKPVADDLNGWLAWMIVQRAKRTKAAGKENLFTDADIAAGNALADTPEKLAAFQKTAKDYEQIKTAILDLAEQAGVISREGREAWDHAEYIPFFRKDDGTDPLAKAGVLGPQVRKRVTDNRPGIRVLMGGEQVLADPLGNILRNFAKLIDSSMKNIALERIVTNLSLNRADVDDIRTRLEGFTKTVTPAQIQRAFARVGLYDRSTGQYTSGEAEFSRADLREALRGVGIKSEQINKAMGTSDADSAFFERVNMETTRALVPMSAVIQSMLDDGVPQSVIDNMPPEALRGMRDLMAFKMPQGPDIFTVLRNGKPTSYRAKDPLLIRSLVGMQPKERSIVTRALSVPARFVTGMITRDPVFMVRNLTRDVLQNWVISEVPYEPVFGSMRGITRSIMETGGAIDMMFAGASFHRGHAQVHDPDATANAVRRVMRAKGMTTQQADAFATRVADSILDFGRNGLEKWDRVGSAVENATREAVYEAAIRAGMTKADAAYMARDVMDFGLRGDSGVINWLADVLPFFNARIQGSYKLYRAGAVPGMGPPMRAAVMGRAMGLVGFSAGLMAMNLALFARGYEELEEWDKDTYWHLAPGTAAHVRIPKPFEIGLIFGTVPERMIRAIQNVVTDGEEGDKLKQTAGAAFSGVWNTLGMNPIPQAVLPMVEVFFNKSLFTQRPIENMGDEKQPKQDVGEWYTSPIAKATADGMSEALQFFGFGPRAGLSSKQVEHLWRGYTGTIGSYALMGADAIVNRLSGSPVVADDFTDWVMSVAPADIPIIPGRSTRPIADIIANGNLADGGTPRNFRQASEFYALADDITVMAAAVKAQLENAQTLYDNGQLDQAEAAEARAAERYARFAGTLGEMEEARTKSGKMDARVKGGVRFENQTAMNRAVKELRESRNQVEATMTDRNLSAVEQKKRLEEIAKARKQVIQDMLDQIKASRANPPETTP